MSYPFDPTKIDKFERDRLSKLRWLPPLAVDASQKRKPAPRNTTFGHKTKARSPKLSDIQNSQTNKFPKADVIKAEQTRRTLQTNPNARFLMSLHYQSIKDAEKKREEMQKRDLITIQAYDWNLVKRISQEKQFHKYVETLFKIGQNLEAENQLENPVSEMESSLKSTEKLDQSVDIVTGLNIGDSVSKLDFVDRLMNYLATSPFRPKLKGQTSMRWHCPDMDKNHVFGKPEKLKEDNEFHRTFSELETLGSTVVNKIRHLDTETEAFSIAPTIAAAIEAIQGAAKSMSRQARKTEKKTVMIKDYNQNPIMKTAQKFDSERSALQRKLIDFLQIRQKEKIESNLEVKMMVDIEHTATMHLKEYLKEERKTKASSIPVPNLWIGRTSASNSIDQYQVLGMNQLQIAHKDVPEKNYSSSDNDLTSLKNIIQNLDTHFDTEDIQAIREMFADDFGDPVPQQVFLGMLGSRRNL